MKEISIKNLVTLALELDLPASFNKNYVVISIPTEKGLMNLKYEASKPYNLSINGNSVNFFNLRKALFKGTNDIKIEMVKFVYKMLNK